MTWFMVDVEANGPCPGLYSMIEVGVVAIDKEWPQPDKWRTFHGKLAPLPGASYVQEALDVVGYSHEHSLTFDDPAKVMHDFDVWIKQNNTSGRPMFISDNNGYDYQWVNYYFHLFKNYNPFGHSSTNLGSLFKGWKNDPYLSFKHLRKTKHDHNPVNDAKGNVEALYQMQNLGFFFILK